MDGVVAHPWDPRRMAAAVAAVGGVVVARPTSAGGAPAPAAWGAAFAAAAVEAYHQGVGLPLAGSPAPDPAAAVALPSGGA
mmetsp:Transcript_33960/g.60654  ORF Transcript_33960/g.60654 Transcript_33960/m.60654 type:complete len:81 (+) Transcript_33960:488-730(+)